MKISRGLERSVIYFQLRRFLPCAILAVLPAALAWLPLMSGWFLAALSVGTAWIAAYPLLYFLTNRKVSSDFGYHIDTVFGLYVIGWLTAAKILAVYINFLPEVLLTVIMLLELLLLGISLLQWVYFYLYGVCIDDKGMMLLQETDYNEAIEYVRSVPTRVPAAVLVFVVLLAAVLFYANVGSSAVVDRTDFAVTGFWQKGMLIGIFLFLSYYFVRKKNGVIARTGIVELYLDVKEYMRTSRLYAQNRAGRIADLQVAPSSPQFKKPSTIIIVIGESASRDYMSAFCDYPEDTSK